MKGVIFRLFEGYVTDTHGEDAWEQILGSAQLQTSEPFVGPGTYPTADLLSLVGTAARVLSIPLEDVLHAFGRYSFPTLARSVPKQMAQLETPHAFLSELEGVIHTEVRKLDPAASPARFSVSDPTPESLTVRYESPFGLFPLVEGFLAGLSDWYRVPIEYERVSTDGPNATYRVRFPESTAIFSGVETAGAR